MKTKNGRVVLIVPKGFFERKFFHYALREIQREHVLLNWDDKKRGVKTIKIPQITLTNLSNYTRGD